MTTSIAFLPLISTLLVSQRKNILEEGEISNNLEEEEVPFGVKLDLSTLNLTYRPCIITPIFIDLKP